MYSTGTKRSKNPILEAWYHDFSPSKAGPRSESQEVPEGREVFTDSETGNEGEDSGQRLAVIRRLQASRRFRHHFVPLSSLPLPLFLFPNAAFCIRHCGLPARPRGNPDGVKLRD